MSNTETAGFIPQWTLGDRLRKAREERSISVESMAADIDRSERTVRNYETDSTRAPPRALMFGPLRTRRAVALGLFAGLRCAEIAALDGSDVWTHQAPAVLVVRNGKGGKDRVVPLHPVLVELLDGVPAAGPLFPGLGGRAHVAPDTISALIRRHFARCGISATPHQLRHTFGTELARQANGNLVAVAAAMGHGSTNTTMQYVGWGGESAAIIAQMFREAA